LAAHKELAVQLAQLEQKVGQHDIQIRAVFEALKKLMEPPSEDQKRKIGFHP